MTIYRFREHVRCVLGDGHDYSPRHYWQGIPSVEADCKRCGRSADRPLSTGLIFLALLVVIPLLKLHRTLRRWRDGEEVSEA